MDTNVLTRPRPAAKIGSRNGRTDGCDEAVVAHDLCETHDLQERRAQTRVDLPQETTRDDHDSETPEHLEAARASNEALDVSEVRFRSDYRDSTGTARRLQALVAIGYSQTALCQRLGLPSSNLALLIHGKRPNVWKKTHDRVDALFAQCWSQPILGESGDRARRLAAKHGWVVPLAWDDIDDPAEKPNIEGEKVVKVKGKKPVLIDDIAIELALRGEKVKLTPAEREIAVRRLHALRWSDGRIAAQLHCTDRTVIRIRVRLGLEAFDFSEIRQVESA